MNGYEFVTNALAFTKNDVGPLLEYMQHTENEWLEFKASTDPKDGRLLEGETEDNYYWNIAKAYISMSNSIGGAILIGVNNVGIPVDLKSSGYTGDAEAFFRKLRDAIAPQKGWVVNGIRRNCPSLKKDSFKIDCRMGTLGEEKVAIIFVEPARVPLMISSDKVPYSLYYRTRGEGSSTQRYDDFNIIMGYWQERETSNRPEFQELLTRFKTIAAAGQFGTKEAEVAEKNRAQLQNAQARLDLYMSRFVNLGKHFLYKDLKEETVCYHKDVYESPFSVTSLKQSNDEPPQLIADDMIRLDSPYSLLQVLQTHRHVFLTGFSGSGKTTRLRHATLTACLNDKPQNIVPIYVNLADYAGGDLLAFVEKSSSIDQELLNQLLASNRVSLVFDGLHKNSTLKKQLTELIKNKPTIHVAVSSQDEEGEDVFGEQEVCSCKLLQLTPMQAEDFLETAFDLGKAYDLLRKEQASTPGELAKKIVSSLRKAQGWTSLSSNPQFLGLVVTLVAKQGSLEAITKNRAQLFKMCVPPAFDIQRLGKIAFKMCLKDFMSIQCGGEEIIIGGERISGAGAEETKVFLADVAFQMPMMLRFDESLKFAFAQDEYRDYFAGEYLRICLTMPGDDRATDLKNLGSGKKENKENFGRWVRVLSLLLDLYQEQDIKDLMDKDNVFTQLLWNADPLLAILSPATDRQLKGFLTLQTQSQDPWHKGVCSIMLGELETPFGELEKLPFKPDKKITLSLLCNEWVGYLAYRYPEVVKNRIDRLIDYSKNNLQPCGGMILKYLSRGIDTLKSEMNGECYGWKSMALGEFEWFLNLDNPAETESLVYLAYGALETHTFMRRGLISMSNDFELFHAHPEKLGIFLWKRLVEIFVVNDDFKKRTNKYRDEKSRLEAATNRSLFEAAARTHQYKFLTVYPMLASVESDYVVGVWDGLAPAQQEKLIKYLPPEAKVNLIAGGKLKEYITDEGFFAEIWPFLNVDASIEVDKVLRDIVGQFELWKLLGKLGEDTHSRLLSHKGGIKKLLISGVIRLGALAPEQGETFFNSAFIIDLLRCLDVSSIAWDELPPPRQEVIRNVLRYGVVLEETGGEVKIKPIDGNLLNLLASEARSQALASHWFVMKPPAGEDFFCEHPALHRRVFAGYDRNEIEKTIGEDAAFVIGKLNWNEDKNNFSLSFPLVGISRGLVSQIRGADDAERSQSIKGKARLLNEGKYTVEAMQETEDWRDIPTYEKLSDPGIRAGAITSLSGRTWTLRVKEIMTSKNGNQVFIAKHQTGSPLVASGWPEEFGVKKRGDIIIAEVSVLVSSKEEFKYRIVDGETVTG